MKRSTFAALFLTSIAAGILGCKDDSGPAASSDAAPAVAATTPPPPTRPPIPVPHAPNIAGSAYILLDFASGQILAAKNENERVEPASLTKIMTAYAVFDAIHSGSLKLTDNVTISEHAWRSGGAVTEGSTSFLPVNSQAPVEVLLRGMIVQSGNDASIALAERVAGTEQAFAQLLNSYGERLKLTGSHFENATGLPGPNHYTTAHDVALLSTAIIRDFPEYYRYFAEKQYMFNGITQRNRNGLLDRDPTVDGLKTGHTENAGYCLATSAKRNDMRLVTVVMGTSSMRAREDATSALLNYGFNFFESQRVFTKGQALASIRVWKGEADDTALVVNRDVFIAVPRGRAAQLKNEPQLPPSLVAPIAAANSAGSIAVTLEGKTLFSEPLYPAQDVSEAGFFGRMIDGIRMTFE